MCRKLRIFFNLLSQGGMMELKRNSIGGGAYDYRALNIERAMN